MKIIMVPTDKCPLDVLAEMGRQTESAWIFLHRNAVEKLVSSADKVITYDGETYFNGYSSPAYKVLQWDKTDEYAETTVMVELDVDKTWLEVYRIEAEDIAFKTPSKDPENIHFLKMME